jgi:hypothetical protein
MPDDISVVRVPQGVQFVREWGRGLSLVLPNGAPELLHRAEMLRQCP